MKVTQKLKKVAVKGTNKAIFLWPANRGFFFSVWTGIQNIGSLCLQGCLDNKTH